MTTRKPDPFAKRLERYMADMMEMRDTGDNQIENWTARHMAQFALRERRRIRREQAGALRHLRASNTGGRCCGDALTTLDRATKARR